MKELYLNNKRLMMSDDTYFPFTQTVSNLEDFSIIGLLASKTISIPRTQQNDEIFGYIGQLNRIAVDDQDNQIGISFNQTKKANYQLYNNSVLISEGILTITGVNDNEYQIELWDKLVELIESLEGDKITGQGFLNNLDIIKSDNSIWSLESNAINIRDLNNTPAEVKPCFNIKEYDSTGKDAIVNYIPTTGTTYARKVELPYELTPIQFRSLKTWEMEYAIPLTTVFRSINYAYDNLIEVDSRLTPLFDELHLNLGSPKGLIEIETVETKPESLGKMGNDDPVNRHWGPIAPTTSLIQSIPLNDFTTNDNLMQKNGKYLIKVPLNIVFDFNSYDGSSSISYLSVWNNVQYLPNIPYGTKFGELFVDVWIKSTDPTDPNWINFTSAKIKVLIPLYYNTNTIVSKNSVGKIYKIELNHTIELPYEYYPNVSSFDNFNSLVFDFTNMWSNTMLFAKKGWYFFYPYVTPTTLKGSIDYSSLDFRTGDILKGQTLFPKLAIKDFIIQIAKYFNLGLMNDEGKLYLHQKDYKISPTAPIIKEISDMQISNFNFSTLRLSTEVSDNDLFKSYNDTTKKIYGEQIVNTGYSIKNTEKSIKFDVAIPSLIQDTSAYAYGEFCSYGNNGYSRVLNGVTQGLEDKVQIGYINILKEPISICNDTLYESCLIDNGIYVPTEVKFLMVNEHITYYQSTDKYTYPIEDYAGQSRLVQQHNTFSPYKFNTNGKVTNSLELNKSDYNYAGLTDDLYPLNSTHYQTYFKKLVTDMYDVNTTVLNTTMWVDEKIDVYNIINYRNSNYVIQEITEYDPTRPDFYEINLLRVNDVTNYAVPKQPNLFHFQLALGFEYLLNGNQLAYKNNFYGGYSDIFISYGNNLNYQYLTSLVPYGLDSDTYYVYPFTHLRQSLEIDKVITESDVYVKLVNNYLQYFETKESGNEFHNFPYPDAMEIHLTYGNYVTGAWEWTSYSNPYILPSYLPVSGDTRQIENFIIYEPILKSITTLGSSESIIVLEFETFYNTSGGNIPFDGYTKCRFGTVQVEWKPTIQMYFASWDDLEGPMWVYSENWGVYSGPISYYNVKLAIYIGYDVPSSELNFNSVDFKILDVSSPSKLKNYEWIVSMDGSWDSKTFEVYSVINTSPVLPYTGDDYVLNCSNVNIAYNTIDDTWSVEVTVPFPVFYNTTIRVGWTDDITSYMQDIVIYYGETVGTNEITAQGTILKRWWVDGMSPRTQYDYRIDNCYATTLYPGTLTVGKYTTPEQYFYTSFNSVCGTPPTEVRLDIIHIDYQSTIV